MFRIVALGAFAFLSLCPVSWADDFKDQTFTNLKTHVDKLPPASTLVVLDVDGTLTNYSDPSAHGPADILKARGNATAWVNGLSAKGYKVVIASAWDKFPETLGRLEKIGISEAVRGKGAGACAQDKDMTFGGAKFKVSYCHVGNVASVQDKAVDPRYFRQKAFAYQLVYPALDLSTIKNVVFGDDSSGNITYFKKDVARAKLFPNAKIDYFFIKPAKGGDHD